MGKRGPKPGTGGRPRMPIDMEVAYRAASIGCTHEEIGALIGMSGPGVKRRIEIDPAFGEALDMARDKGRATLRRYQWQAAANGNSTMLMWLGKNMLDQTDRREITGPGGAPIEMIVTGVRRGPEIEGAVERETFNTGVTRAIADDDC